MRIHTSANYAQMLRTLRGLSGVYFDVLTEHGSRTHPRAFEVRLEGNGHRMNTGTHGAGYSRAATWDEWGVFFGRLYEIDPEARCWAYYDAADFHERTSHRFTDGMPKDTHKRHTWRSVDVCTGAVVRRCTTCTAVQRVGGVAA